MQNCERLWDVPIWRKPFRERGFRAFLKSPRAPVDPKTTSAFYRNSAQAIAPAVDEHSKIENFFGRLKKSRFWEEGKKRV